MPETSNRPRGRRRAGDALSKDVVVAAAIELLDEHGERGFTFPLLTTRLRTGNGAIYWHVANKDELVLLAADRILVDALPDPSAASSASDAVRELRATALSVFDALDRHLWAAAHITAESALPGALGVLERIGSLLSSAGLPASRRFVTATAIFTHIVGVSARLADAAIRIGATTSRDDFLAQNAARWAGLDPEAYPFLTAVAPDLRDHDDREQFAAGLDLLLDGVATLLP